MSEPRKAYPPTCLLCRHFSFQPGEEGFSNGGDDTGHPYYPAALCCARRHYEPWLRACEDINLLLKATDCPDFEEVTAAEREGRA